jgi:hypothetical protein
MDCARVRLPGGGVAIVCGRGMRPRRRCRCGCDATLECDWKVGGMPIGRGVKTCDAPICSAHAFEVGPDKHLCPAHVTAYRRWLVDVQQVPLT